MRLSTRASSLTCNLLHLCLHHVWDTSAADGTQAQQAMQHRHSVWISRCTNDSTHISVGDVRGATSKRTSRDVGVDGLDVPIPDIQHQERVLDVLNRRTCKFLERTLIANLAFQSSYRGCSIWGSGLGTGFLHQRYLNGKELGSGIG